MQYRSGHVCLWCGETNVEVEGIVLHQKRKNHFGGHYVKVVHADEPQDDGSDDDGSEDEEDDEAILCRLHSLEDDM